MRDTTGRFLDFVFASLAQATFMHWSLLAVIVFLASLLAWCQFQPDDFDLRHLVVSRETGKLDRFEFVSLVGALFLTWAFIHYAILGKADFMLFVAYGLLLMFPKVIDAIAVPLVNKWLGILPPHVSAAPAPNGGSPQ